MISPWSSRFRIAVSASIPGDAARIDERVGAFLDRLLAGDWPYRKSFTA
jgi:hypothetical protein